MEFSKKIVNISKTDFTFRQVTLKYLESYEFYKISVNEMKSLKALEIIRKIKILPITVKIKEETEEVKETENVQEETETKPKTKRKSK